MLWISFFVRFVRIHCSVPLLTAPDIAILSTATRPSSSRKGVRIRVASRSEASQSTRRSLVPSARMPYIPVRS